MDPVIFSPYKWCIFLHFILKTQNRKSSKNQRYHGPEQGANLKNMNNKKPSWDKVLGDRLKSEGEFGPSGHIVLRSGSVLA